MLSREDNETLVRIGPGTPMGELIRHYWIPALLSSELPEPDGTPVRVRLLGEDLVAFRDSTGRVGLLEEHCPHRRASLALGINDKGGLRCLYHGWKFATDGRCLEIPTEPAGSRKTERPRARGYATHEAGGMVWAFMGPQDRVADFPDFEWLGMPATHSVPFKMLAECNYAQVMEGTIDSAHAGVLHREQPWDAPAKYDHERDLTPKIEFELTPYGLRYAGVRKFREAETHVRVTQVVLPFMTLIPPPGAGPAKHRRMANVFVPCDDESTWHIQWFFDETQPIDVAFRLEEGGYWMDEHFRKKLNIGNWYGQDREWMKTGMMSGIKGVVTQDHAVSETQGRILDRTKEHLGASDAAVVAWRRQIIRAARALAETGELPAALRGEWPWGQIKAVTLVCPDTQSWKEAVPKVSAAA
jgi:phenylpropionate dioxygenase-like ring-hydroxylating dioxygenase large terminal subunit